MEATALACLAGARQTIIELPGKLLVCRPMLSGPKLGLAHIG